MGSATPQHQTLSEPAKPVENNSEKPALQAVSSSPDCLVNTSVGNAVVSQVDPKDRVNSATINQVSLVTPALSRTCNAEKEQLFADKEELKEDKMEIEALNSWSQVAPPQSANQGSTEQYITPHKASSQPGLYSISSLPQGAPGLENSVSPVDSDFSGMVKPADSVQSSSIDPQSYHAQPKEEPKEKVFNSADQTCTLPPVPSVKHHNFVHLPMSGFPIAPTPQAAPPAQITNNATNGQAGKSYALAYAASRAAGYSHEESVFMAHKLAPLASASSAADTMNHFQMLIASVAQGPNEGSLDRMNTGNSCYPPYSGHCYGQSLHQAPSSGAEGMPCPPSWQQPLSSQSYLIPSPYASSGVFPQSSGVPYYHGYYTPLAHSRVTAVPRPKISRPRQPKPPVVERLALSPVEFPSPYALTHVVHIQQFVIVKKKGENFGLSFVESKKSVLVDPDWLWEYEKRLKKGTATEATSPPSKTITDVQANIKIEQRSSGEAKTDNIPSEAGKVEATAKQAESSDGQTNIKVEESLSGEAKTNNIPSDAEKVEATAEREESKGAQTNIKVEESLIVEARKDSPLEAGIVDVTAIQEESKPPLPTTANSVIAGTIKPLLTPNAPSDIELMSASNMGELKIEKLRKKRRKRHSFAVLAVMDAETQNKRLPSNMHLVPGDIVLSINGQHVGGYEFREACTFFAKGCTEKEEDGVKTVRCTLTIARKKPEPKPVYCLPSHISTPSTQQLPTAVVNQSLSTVGKPISGADVKEYVSCVMKALVDPTRALGSTLPDELIRKFVSLSPRLVGREFALNQLWNTIALASERKMASAAETFWAAKWDKEPEDVRKAVSCAFLTDAKRATMRSAPRPSKGCKCGSEGHEYVTDKSCPLYSDLRALATGDTDSPQSVRRKAKKGDGRTLNVVETAFKERIVKLQSEQKLEEEEAAFVDEMEVLQVKELKKAVFAPSVTVMVLSAVADLQDEFPTIDAEEPVPIATDADPLDVEEDQGDEEGDDDDDDDDVPLSALGKREADSSQDQNKKQKVSEQISEKFLARLLRLTSERWGHLYREYDHPEYAW